MQNPRSIRRSCLGFPSSFGICHSDFESLGSFACRARLMSSGAVPHAHPYPIVQLAQAAGGDEGARFESGEDLLLTFPDAAHLDRLGARDAVLDQEYLAYARKSADRIEWHDERGGVAVEHQLAARVGTGLESVLGI